MNKPTLKTVPVIILSNLIFVSCSMQEKTSEVSGHEKSSEPYRHQLHFTPEAKWMNDPNGLVFHNGEYQKYFL